MFDRFTDEIDWTNPHDVGSMVRVFEEILSWITSGDDRESIVRQLARDGLTVDDLGRITGIPKATEIDIPLDGLTDPASILEHLERISDTIDSDPSVAISGAKALIEATTKLVLAELSVPYD